MLRKSAHSTEDQMKKEGIFVPFEQTLATITFAHNALVKVDGHTAYNAVYGRTPNLLPTFDGATEAERQDDLPRCESLTRYHSRAREIAIAKIIEHTAQDRMQRAEHHRSRPALELEKITAGQQVDIWFEPSHKDLAGWRGPATVLSVQADENAITVRYQGRALERRGQEVRDHVAYLIFVVSQKAHPHVQWQLLRETVEGYKIGTMKTYGLILHHDPRSSGWHLTKDSQCAHGRKLLEAGLFVAATVAHMETCTTLRFARGVAMLQPHARIQTASCGYGDQCFKDEMNMIHPWFSTTRMVSWKSTYICMSSSTTTLW